MRRTSYPNPPRDGVIHAGILNEGTSNLAFHALRPNGTAACSSYLCVAYAGKPAASIKPENRCRSRACQALFKKADSLAAPPNPEDAA